jgi:hypothetical protein
MKPFHLVRMAGNEMRAAVCGVGALGQIRP